MKKNVDLASGNIFKTLLVLSLPILGTSFIETAYSLVDMIWIGRVGSSAVAAVGTAGFFTWLAVAFITVSKAGAQIKVSQSIGANELSDTKKYISGAMQVNIVLSILYMIVLLVFMEPLIGFFKLTDSEVIEMSYSYLTVVALGMIFYFINPVFTAIFIAAGDSKRPFLINTTGLLINIVLDPILILGLGGIPAMGVLGAALATVFAQIVVTISYIILIKRSKSEYLHFNLFEKPSFIHIKSMCNIGLPVAIQSGLFTIFSMVIGRIVAAYGPIPIAVQKVGSQIEAISWMTAGGFSTALGAFVGQNYGARQYDRIEKGYRATMYLAIALGVFATVLLIGFGRPLFSVFLPEADAIEQGNVYLQILGVSQLFMCIEITTQGLFNGLGRTYIPSVISIIFTGARIPLAYFLAQPHLLGINGVWWAITISSIIKGILIVGIYLYIKKKNTLYPCKNTAEEELEIQPA
ncbi:MAG TPA: MATE family efflux transporter [Firmicutes bacterium]|nr:MATE family efflux transporter [Bacillota bacterium]